MLMAHVTPTSQESGVPVIAERSCNTLTVRGTHPREATHNMHERKHISCTSGTIFPMYFPTIDVSSAQMVKSVGE